jgi:hypothetical protein
MQIDVTYTGKRPNSAVFACYHMQIDATKCKPLVDILVDVLAADGFSPILDPGFALPDLYDVTVRVADVASNLAVLVQGFG